MGTSEKTIVCPKCGAPLAVAVRAIDARQQAAAARSRWDKAPKSTAKPRKRRPTPRIEDLL